MGLGDVADKVIPKPVLLSEPGAGGTIRVRYFMPHTCHKSLAITGSIGIATATIIEGSVAHHIVAGQPRRRIPISLILNIQAGKFPYLYSKRVMILRKRVPQ